jgi:hypothetical protein
LGTVGAGCILQKKEEQNEIRDKTSEAIARNTTPTNDLNSRAILLFYMRIESVVPGVNAAASALSDCPN